MRFGTPRRVSVAAYIVIAFGVSVIGLGIVMITTTRTSLAREHEGTLVDLRAAAHYAAEDAALIAPEKVQFLRAVAADPNISSFDHVLCHRGLDGFATVAQQGNVFVLAPDGSVVCHLKEADGTFPLPQGNWVVLSQNSQGFAASVSLAADTGRPLINLAAPISGASGIGALVTTWDAAGFGLEMPKNAARGVELLELDATRTVVVAASDDAPEKVGRLPSDSWMRKAVGGDVVRTDSDGVSWYWQEVSVRGLDHVVLAGITRSAAMAHVQEELRNNVFVGLVVVVLVVLLGFLMHRSIARPVRALTSVIAAAAEAEHEIEAVPRGPNEIAEVARAFNSTMHERRLLEQQLASALKDAQRASKLKSEFLANMSHEIRTPMNGVLGILSVLDDAEMSGEVRDSLRTVSDSANGLMTMLNELLDFSKLEAGMMTTESVPFDVRATVRRVISPWVAIAGRKDVALGASFEPEVPEVVLGDATRLRQILSNLVDNAVKFTSRGHVSVNTSRVRGDTLRFEIEDSGIGISEEGRAHLFEPFVQVDGTTTRRYGGTGLGLAICHQLVEVMGGRIGVDSISGVGSTFWLELPLPAAHERNGPPPKATAAPPPVVAAPGHGASLLVVEDNLVNQKVASQMLTKLGYDVTLAADGEQALSALAGDAFDAVLMDLQMPVMDGLQATTEIRRRGYRMPVVAMTASALPEDREHCLRVGMNGYVVKPMNVESLGDELTRVLNDARETAAV